MLFSLFVSPQRFLFVRGFQRHAVFDPVYQNLRAGWSFSPFRNVCDELCRWPGLIRLLFFSFRDPTWPLFAPYAMKQVLPTTIRGAYIARVKAEGCQMIELLKKFLNYERWQVLIEYAVLLAFLALAVIALLPFLGKAINNILS